MWKSLLGRRARILFHAFTLFLASPLFAQSVEDLLREADLTLKGKRVEKPPKSKAQKTAAPKAAAEGATAAPTATTTPEETAPAEVKTHFNPTEAAQILRADLKAIQDEQTKRDPRVDFSMLAGRLTFSPSFELYKDDDTFRLDRPAQWTGGGVEMTAGWTLFRLGQFGFQGVLGGSLGYYSGHGVVSRTGVQTRVYEMYLMTVPMEVGGGLAIAWKDHVQLSVRVGPSLNVINQRGLGTQDTLSGVFGGDYGLASLKVRVSSNWSLRTDLRRQGITNKNLLSESVVFGASYNLH